MVAKTADEICEFAVLVNSRYSGVKDDFIMFAAVAAYYVTKRKLTQKTIKKYAELFNRIAFSKIRIFVQR